MIFTDDPLDSIAILEPVSSHTNAIPAAPGNPRSIRRFLDTAWLTERRSYLGGTDLAGIMGCHPNISPLTVYCSKLGITEPAEETKAMRRGTRMEPYIAETFAHVYEWPVRKASIVRHSTKPYLAVNPDFETDDPERGLTALETKSHKFFVRDEYGEDWTDQIPAREVIQGTWQCRLGGYSSCIVAVMFGMDEDDLHPFRVTYDPELGDMIEEAGDRFWRDHILTETPPEVTGQEADTDLISRLHPFDRGTTLVADERANRSAELLRDARNRRKMYEAEEAEHANFLKAYMADAAVLETSVGAFTWKTAKSGQVSWKSIVDDMGGAPAHLIAKHTGAGSRRFLTPADWRAL